jgi:hypothetical protein
MLIDFLDLDAYPINLGEVFLYDCKGVSAMLVVPSEWSVDLFMDKLKRVTCRASNRCYVRYSTVWSIKTYWAIKVEYEVP